MDFLSLSREEDSTLAVAECVAPGSKCRGGKRGLEHCVLYKSPDAETPGNITDSRLCQLALWGPSPLLSLQFSQHVSDEPNGDHVWFRATEVTNSYYKAPSEGPRCSPGYVPNATARRSSVLNIVTLNL